MRRSLSFFTLIALLVSFAAPSVASAGTIDPSLIPDGTYNATVEKVVDDKHVMVKMENGVEALLTTNRSNVAFNKCKPNDQIKMSLIKGMVAVYAVTH